MTAVHTGRLANGLTTVLVEVPASHQVLVSLMVRAGARFDPAAQAGISHFLEHLLFRGNASYPDVASLFESFERAGELLNAQTGVEFTEYYQVVHPDLLPECLSSLAAFVRTPRFSDLEKERRIILDEILYDYNEQGELIRLDTIVAEMLWGSHPLAHNVTGTRATVSAFTPQAVREHYGSYYRPANAVLAMAGHLDAGRAGEWVRRHFGDWGPAGNGRVALSAPSWPPAGRAPRLRTVWDADNQVRLQLSFPVEGYRSDQEIPLSLLSSILDDGPNSRLQKTIREELALVYYIGCGYTAFCDAGQLDITTAVPRERLDELLGALFTILRDLREHGVGEGELEAAKRRYRFDLEFSRDSLDAALDRFAWPLLFGEVRTEEAEWAVVEATSAAALSQLAREALARERLHLAAVGPVDEEVRRLLKSHLERY
jgi:predicted Zn-dependent peptidase